METSIVQNEVTAPLLGGSPIPDDAQVENAKATFENGVLTISIPVPESKRRRREIPIEGRDERSQTESKAASTSGWRSRPSTPHQPCP